MKLIKYDTVNIEAVLAVCLCGKHLIKRICRQIHDSFLGGQNFYSFGKCRTHPHHISGNIKNDRCLLSVGSTAVDFGSLLTVPAGQKQGNSGSKLAFSIFFGISMYAVLNCL